MNNLGGKQILQIAFLAILVLAIPFILVGNSRNTTIERCIKSINSSVERGDYVEAEKNADEAYNQFGIVYQCYVASLHLFGGKYYVESKILPLRARMKCLAIAQLMSEGSVNLEKRIESAKESVKQASKVDTSKTFKIVEDGLPQLEKLLPLAKLCSEKKYKECSLKFQKISSSKDLIGNPLLWRPVSYIGCELAKNHKDTKNLIFATILLPKLAEISGDKFIVRLLQSLNNSLSKTPKKNTGSSFKIKYRNAMKYAKKRKYKKALSLLKECRSLKPENDKIAYGVALMQYRTGNKSEAKKICELLTKKNPGNSKAKKLLSKL